MNITFPDNLRLELPAQWTSSLKKFRLKLLDKQTQFREWRSNLSEDINYINGKTNIARLATEFGQNKLEISYRTADKEAGWRILVLKDQITEKMVAQEEFDLLEADKTIRALEAKFNLKRWDTLDKNENLVPAFHLKMPEKDIYIHAKRGEPYLLYNHAAAYIVTDGRKVQEAYNYDSENVLQPIDDDERDLFAKKYLYEYKIKPALKNEAVALKMIDNKSLIIAQPDPDPEFSPVKTGGVFALVPSED